MANPPTSFDITEMIARCSTSDVATPSTSCLPEPGGQPDPPGLDSAGNTDNEWCKRMQRCLHPAHLFPPLSAQPFLLRARFACNWADEESITFPVGLWTRRILDWYVPRGQRYTTKRAYADVVGNFSEVCLGFRVYRNDKLWFDGDNIETNHGNGVISKMARLGHIGTFYSRDSIKDPSDSSNIIDFPSTFEPGEKISIDVIKNSGVTNAQISANFRMTGYLYSQELFS